MRKILVARYETIGDTIFASAFYRELRKALPDAQIDAIADKTSRPIMENCPYINNIIDLPDKSKKYLKYFELFSTFKQYDTIYCLKNNHFCSKLAFLTGVKNRIGFKEKTKKNKYLNLTVPYNEDRHEIDCYLDLLRVSNIPVTDTSVECWIPPLVIPKVNEFLDLAKGRKKVLIQAYGRYKIKDWYDESWVEVIRYLSETLGIQVYYAGGEKEKQKYENLNNQLGTISIKPINLCGELTIQETLSMISKTDMLIGIDSGLSHIAAGLKLPQIYLHGPTSIVRWQPRNKNCITLSKNLPCSPCAYQSGSKNTCQDRICMKSITPEMVIAELDNAFKLTTV
ncbi:MAG: glycosyltransferase family 9 protein [Muribaculaceae bacterium]|nr:glycosyltransferase family 9 protein [Muribaculaceae bacterium]